MPLKHFSPPCISDPSRGLAAVALPARFVFFTRGTFVTEVRPIRKASRLPHGRITPLPTDVPSLKGAEIRIWEVWEHSRGHVDSKRQSKPICSGAGVGAEIGG